MRPGLPKNCEKVTWRSSRLCDGLGLGPGAPPVPKPFSHHSNAPTEYFLALVEHRQATAAVPCTLGKIGGAVVRLAGFDLRNLVVDGAALARDR